MGTDIHGNPLPIEVYTQLADAPARDAFGRQRIAGPVTIFDSKQLFDAQPLIWDDQETSGGGTSSTHSTDLAASTMSVSNLTAGTRVRQTFRAFNYFPGKSQKVMLTFAGFDTSTGITKRIGQFNANNGLFLESAEGVVNVVRRTHVTGSPVDNIVAQSSWNLDTMDGQGPSGIALDFSKGQLLVIDYLWLGVGRVRFGFLIDGVVVYVHQMLNSNNLSTVFMSTPCLPLRCEISNDGNGAADNVVQICATIMSEGGLEPTGVVRYTSVGAISSLLAGNTYAVLGLRLKAAALQETVDILNVSLLSTVDKDQLEFSLLLNPTVAGTFTYGDVANSALQTATGSVSNTVTGGTVINGGFLVTVGGGAATTVDHANALRLGSFIDATPVTIVLCVTPITASVNVYAAVTWREQL